jgi:hypothetical protein
MFDGEINGTAGVSYKAMFKRQKGGKMNVLEFLKDGGQIRKMQTGGGTSS